VELPPYRYVPGRSPHPRTDPRGHSHGRPEPKVASADLSDAGARELYVFGVELFNAGYYWESHEAFEALWNAAERKGPVANFFQGLIQVAAAHLKRIAGAEARGRALAARGVARLSRCPSPFFGLDVHAFARSTEFFFASRDEEPPRIELGALP
jgi:uncharacterized protein